MNSISRNTRFLVSYELFFYLIGTFLLLYTVLVFVFQFHGWSVLNLMPSKVLAVFIFFNRFLGFSSDLKNKRPYSIFSAGIFIVVFGLLFAFAYSFEGIAGLGEGEGFAKYERVKKGCLSNPPGLNITVEQINAEPNRHESRAEITIRKQKEEPVKLGLGRYYKWTADGLQFPASLFPKLKIKIKNVEPAPRFLIKDEKGNELHSAFVKLNISSKSREDYFRSPTVAHRFYLSLTGNTDKPLNIRIMRGKLTIEEKQVALNEEVQFEGLRISFPEISKWAEIQVNHYPGQTVILIGVILSFAGLIYYSLKKNI